MDANETIEKRRKKMIRIETEKLVNGLNEQAYKVVSIEALRQSELLEAYMNGVGIDRVYLTCLSEDLCLVYLPAGKNAFADNLLRTGYTYSCETFAEKLKIVRRCGNNLHKINKEKKALAAEWNGNQTFVI